PLTQKEFYQLFAYFNNVPEHGKFRRVGNSPPYIVAPLPEQQAQLKQLDEQLTAANSVYAKLQPDLTRAQREWERSLDTSKPLGWAPASGLVAHFSFDGDLKPQVAVLQEAKGSRSPAYVRPGTNGNAAVSKPSVPPSPAFAPGQIGQA